MNSLKKNILLIGSDSEIAQNFLNYATNRNDNLITVSRKKISSVKSNKHYSVDLANSEEVNKLVQNIKLDDFDTFIYCPGIFMPKNTIEITHDEIESQINVNLVSAICLSIPVLQKMTKNGRGMMLFIGSSSAYSGFKKTSLYCSAKHGLLGFTRSLCDEFRNLGIRISCISPGSINTKMSIPLHKNMDPKTFILPNEISKLLVDLVYFPNDSMWQEEIILKRLKY